MLQRALLFSFLASGLCLACTQSEDDACSSGSYYGDGYCRPSLAGGGAAAGSGATGAVDAGGSPSEGGAGGALEPAAIDPSFNEACTSHEDCEPPTDYCADSPVDPPAYCTVKGCDEDPSVCPPGWECTDVGMFIPGEPFVCTRPVE
jgi:hypothetical protein